MKIRETLNKRAYNPPIFAKPTIMKGIPSFSRDERTNNSLKHSVKDGIFFSIMSGISESYFSAFAIALKATAPQIAILASLPQLLASAFQLLAVWLGQSTGLRKGIIVFGAGIQCIALLMVAILPLLYPDYVFPVLLIALFLYYTGPNLGSPLWGSLMGALVGENIRGRFFATRTRLSTLASFTALVVGGVTLQASDVAGYALAGFVLIFALGVVSRAVSAWHLAQIYDPPHDHAIDGDIKRFLSARFFEGQVNFFRFSFFFACMQFAVAISGPFVVVYLLRDLHFNYVELMANTAASIVVQFMVLSRWGRLSDIFGNRIILKLTGFIIPVVPCLWVLSTNFWYLLAVQAFSGLVWSGFSLAASNYVYDLTTSDKRAGLMALHGVLAALAVFIGASLGGLLVLILPTEVTFGGIHFEWLSVFYGVFLISALARISIATLFLPHIDEVRRVRHIGYSGLIFRVTRFSPVSGLIFETIGRLPGKTKSRSEEY